MIIPDANAIQNHLKNLEALNPVLFFFVFVFMVTKILKKIYTRFHLYINGLKIFIIIAS